MAGVVSSARRGRRRFGPTAMAEINIIPLVDVTLVILIIFMVTTTFDKNKNKDIPKQKMEQDSEIARAVPVNLPQVSASIEKPALDMLLIIGVDAKGQKFVGDSFATTEVLRKKIKEMAAKNPDTKVRIDADREARFENVIEIVEMCQIEGLDHLSFHTSNNDAKQ